MSLINGDFKDDELRAAEAHIESILRPGARATYKQAVNAGMSIGLHQGAEGVAKLLQAEDKAKACGLAAANIMLLMSKQSKSMPPEVIPYAAVTLMLQAMDILSKAGKMDPTNEDIARGTHAVFDRIMQALGWTMPKLNAAAQQVQEIMADPVKMEQINRRGGVVKDPRASTPTEVPEAPEEPADDQAQEEAADGV